MTIEESLEQEQRGLRRSEVKTFFVKNEIQLNGFSDAKNPITFELKIEIMTFQTSCLLHKINYESRKCTSDNKLLLFFYSIIDL